MTTGLLTFTRRAGGPLSEGNDAQGRTRAANCGPRRSRAGRSETVASHSYGLGREISDADQVVRGESERKHPVHAARTPMACLPHQPDGLEPAEDFLHPLAPLLADRVARVEEIFGWLKTIDRKSTRLNSSHQIISYAVFCLK